MFRKSDMLLILIFIFSCQFDDLARFDFQQRLEDTNIDNRLMP
jgi:hypothetical protein